jgi:hypothetical protein
LPSVDPVTVIDSLARQRLTPLIRFDGSDPSPGGGSAKKEQSIAYNHLPTPHPLDYCWWFDPITISALCIRIKALTSPDDGVVLLGTPTLLRSLANASRPGKVTLIDADPATVRMCRLGVRTAGLLQVDVGRDSLPDTQGELVLADPPWYELETKSFLWAARQMCVTGGHILVSVPPEGTRPGVAQEFSRIATWTRTLGLELVRFDQGCLSYLSPLFEQNALRAAGVPITDLRWRRGDLAVFRCLGKCEAVRPPADCVEEWEERTFETVRVRTRARRSVGWEDPTLSLVAETEILPSFSRRDPLRRAVDVWTSGNRVFRCAGTRTLLEILDAIRAGDDVIARVQEAVGTQLTVDRREQTRSAATALLRIIETESAEVVAWRELDARMDVVTG